MNLKQLTLGFLVGIVAMVVIGAALSPSNLDPTQFTNSGPANGQPFMSLKDGAVGTNVTINNITNQFLITSNVVINNSLIVNSNVTFRGRVTINQNIVTNLFATNTLITYLTNITAYVTNLFAVTEYVTNLNVTYLTNQTFYTTNVTAITVNATTNFVTENFSTNLFSTNIFTTNLFATFITNNTFFTTNVNTTQLTVNSNLFVTTNTFVTDITTNIFVTFSTNIFLTDNFVSNYFTTNVFNDTFMSNYFNTNLYLYVTNVAVTNLYVTNIVNNNSYVSNFFQTNIFQNTYNSNFFSTNLFSTVNFITTNFFLFPGTNFPGLYGQALITDGLSNDFWAFVFHSANLSNEGPLTVLGSGTAAGTVTVYDGDGTTGLGGFSTNAGKKGFWTASPYGFTDGSGPGDNSIAISGSGGRIKYTTNFDTLIVTNLIAPVSSVAGPFLTTNGTGTDSFTYNAGALTNIQASALPTDVAYTDKNNAWTSASSNYWASPWSFPSNLCTMAPNFAKLTCYISTNASFTFLIPTGVDTTKTEEQWTLQTVTNTLGSVILAGVPAGVDFVGEGHITNRSDFWWRVYAGQFTNCYALPTK